MYTINEDEKLTADFETTITVPVSNNSCDNFVIYHDGHLENAIDILVDWCVEHDETVNRETHCAFTLSDEEIAENNEEGCLGDYTYGGNCGSYLNFVIMQDYVSECQNPYKED